MKRATFGWGNPRARYMVVGVAPCVHSVQRDGGDPVRVKAWLTATSFETLVDALARMGIKMKDCWFTNIIAQDPRTPCTCEVDQLQVKREFAAFELTPHIIACGNEAYFGLHALKLKKHIMKLPHPAVVTRNVQVFDEYVDNCTRAYADYAWRTRSIQWRRRVAKLVTSR